MKNFRKIYIYNVIPNIPRSIFHSFEPSVSHPIHFHSIEVCSVHSNGRKTAQNFTLPCILSFWYKIWKFISPTKFKLNISIINSRVYFPTFYNFASVSFGLEVTVFHKHPNNLLFWFLTWKISIFGKIQM